jgi:hypothetical protein
MRITARLLGRALERQLLSLLASEVQVFDMGSFPNLRVKGHA